MPMLGRYTTSPARIIEVKTAPAFPAGVKPLAAAPQAVFANEKEKRCERQSPAPLSLSTWELFFFSCAHALRVRQPWW
jgi:hypothetical protein